MIKNIPTNLIMGFLGVGKTSAILNLLEQKPAHEKWAVLVNEFGNIGIDGAIYASKGIQVKEVAGGCMCCTAGVPLQVAVNHLLKSARPQRLLIEPSGLGHPKRVLDTLRGEHFQRVLALNASICLVDPRKLKDARYTTHENFIDQIAMCDILVANKIDLADKEALQLFDQLANNTDPKKLLVSKTCYGKLKKEWLDLHPDTSRVAHYPAYHAFKPAPAEQTAEKTAQNGPSKTAIQSGPETKDGFQSIGWVLPSSTLFDYDCIASWLGKLGAERIKAIIATNKGWVIFNANTGQMDVTQIKEMTDNRIEIIGVQLEKKKLEEKLLRCTLPEDA